MTKIKPDTELQVENEENQSSSSTILDQIDSFNKLINSFIAAYNKYNQINEQIVLEYQNDENIYQETSSGTSDQKKTQRSALFDKFMQVFDDILLEILKIKRDSFYLFIHIFQLSNLNIIKFYECINKLLNVECKSGSNPKCQSIILHKSLEVLHVLTTNQGKEYEDDESTVMCCEQLAHSFNFTGSLCSILIVNSVNKYINPMKKSRHAVLDENDYKITFDILNKLTRDNPLFNFDDNIKQFINYLVDKV